MCIIVSCVNMFYRRTAAGAEVLAHVRLSSTRNLSCFSLAVLVALFCSVGTSCSPSTPGPAFDFPKVFLDVLQLSDIKY